MWYLYLLVLSKDFFSLLEYISAPASTTHSIGTFINRGVLEACLSTIFED